MTKVIQHVIDKLSISDSCAACNPYLTFVLRQNPALRSAGAILPHLSY
jgi:hypothetical protein